MKIQDLGDRWNIAYQKCLESYKVTEAIKIAHYYKPKKLYKYFSFDNYWKDNIQNGTLVFNSVYNFNDPLDSRWYLDYERIIKKRVLDDGRDPTSVEDFLEIIGRNGTITLYEEDLLPLYDSFRISCFSETPCSNVMWGHYANKHNGFCLEYDVDKITSIVKPLMPVVYTEKPFDASDIIDMRGIDDKYVMICPALFKSKDWSYEKEWRLILPKKEETLLYHIPEAITGVYLGFKTLSNESADELESIAEEHNIPVYRMLRGYLSYDLVYSSVSDLKNGKSKGFLI